MRSLSPFLLFDSHVRPNGHAALFGQLPDVTPLNHDDRNRSAVCSACVDIHAVPEMRDPVQMGMTMQD